MVDLVLAWLKKIISVLSLYGGFGSGLVEKDQ